MSADERISRAQPQRVLCTTKGFIVSTLNGEWHAKTSVRQREVRVQLQGPAAGAHRFVVATHPPEHDAMRQVGPGSRSSRPIPIRASAFASCATALRSPDHIRPLRRTPGEQAVGLSVVGCDCNGAPTQRLGFSGSRPRTLGDKRQCADHTFPGVEAFRRLALAAVVHRVRVRRWQLPAL